MCSLIFGFISGGFIGVLIGLPISLGAWLTNSANFWECYIATIIIFSFLGFVVNLIKILFSGLASSFNSVLNGKPKTESFEKKQEGWTFLEKNISKALGQATEDWLNSKTYVKPHRRKDGSYVKGHYRRKHK